MSTVPLAAAVQLTLADAVDESLAAALAGREATCLWCGGHDIEVRTADLWSGSVAVRCRHAAPSWTAWCPGTSARCRDERALPSIRRCPGASGAEGRGAAAVAFAGARRRRLRRRRRVAGLVRFAVFLLLIFVAVWAGVRVAHAGEDGRVYTGDSYTVQAGDDLWTIAASHYGDAIDLRKAVYVIQEANDLDGAVLQPGEELSLPYLEE